VVLGPLRYTSACLDFGLVGHGVLGPNRGFYETSIFSAEHGDRRARGLVYQMGSKSVPVLPKSRLETYTLSRLLSTQYLTSLKFFFYLPLLKPSCVIEGSECLFPGLRSNAHSDCLLF
jgi:hypothetical protein